jgi:hypothetical protein
MSPQPIDAQSLIGRMAAADRAQHKTERQPLVQQERVALQTPAESAQKEKQVQHTDQADNTPVQERKREESASGKRRRGRKKRSGKDKDSATPEEVVSSEPATYNPRTGKEPPAADEGSLLDLEA